MAEEEISIRDKLEIQISLADQIVKLAQEAESSKPDCLEIAKKAYEIFQLLHSAAHITDSATLYERPLRLIISDVSLDLLQALSLVQRCKKVNIPRPFFSPAGTEFHIVTKHLDSSIKNLFWVISIFNFNDVTTRCQPLPLPPIANNNPFLCCVWFHISAVQMGQPVDRVNGANKLALFATHDLNIKLIVQEAAIPPLLDLLEQGDSPEARASSLTALYNLATCQETVKLMSRARAVSIISKILDDSWMDVQILAVNLVTRMAAMDNDVKEEFGTGHVTWKLLQILKNIHMSINDYGVNLKFRIASALSKLSKGSLLNCRIISEPNSLLCLAKLVEIDQGELRRNCLNTIMELTAVAEFYSDFRLTVFNPKSNLTTSLLCLFLKFIKEENDPNLLIPAMKSLCSFARNFPPTESRLIIGLMVPRLGHTDAYVSKEATLALTKFVCPMNINRFDHSKTIIELEGVQWIMNMIMVKSDDKIKLCGLQLLCYLALFAEDCSALLKAGVSNALKSGLELVSRDRELKEMFSRTIKLLKRFQDGAT